MSHVTSYANGTPSWMDLMTSDREAALRFYGALFGWRFEVGPPESGHYTTCLLDGDPVAGIGERPADADYPVAWTTYLAVDDVDKTCAAVTEHGGQVLMPPMDVFEEGRMAMAADPTGAVFGMWQAGKHTGARRVNEPGAICWNEVTTGDTEGAARFYTDVFGMTAEKMDSEFDYRTLQVAGRTVAGVFNPPQGLPEGVPPYWMGYFAVDDTDGAVERVTAGGGSVIAPPMDSPYGRIAVVSDPQGAVLSVMAMATEMPQ